MKIHEYQAKKLLKNYDIPIQDGCIVDNFKELESTCFFEHRCSK